MKFKAVFFDCEGVLTFEHMWVKFHEFVGIPKELNFKWRNEFYSGKISWKQWFNKFEPYYRDRRFNKNDLERLTKDINFNPEATNIVKYLLNKHVLTAVISGSIEKYVKLVAETLHLDAYKANTSLEFDHENIFIRFKNVADEVHAKVIFIEELCKKHGLLPKEVLFVGDSMNDSAAFQLTGNGVLYNKFDRPEEEGLEKLAWKIIKNLNEIKDFV